MTVSWPGFFAVIAGAFVALNVVFAGLYALGKDPIANARFGDFYDLFYFSVETSLTVGYGDMHPQTLYAHAVATVEGFVAVVLIALMTGLTFARFSRPRARLIFARNPVVAEHNGVPTLIFRLANARNAFISEATAKLWMLSGDGNARGAAFRRLQAAAADQEREPGAGAELDVVPSDRRRKPAVRLGDGRISWPARRTSSSASPASTRPRRRPCTRATPSPLRTCGRVMSTSTFTASTTPASAISTTPASTTRGRRVGSRRSRYNPRRRRA